MVPSLLSWQGRRTPGNPQAAFHTKAQNVPAFLFPKVPPASCVPHTDLVCVFCRSPVLSRRKSSTIHTCASLPALNLDHTDLPFDLVGSHSQTTHATDLPSYAVVGSPSQTTRATNLPSYAVVRSPIAMRQPLLVRSLPCALYILCLWGLACSPKTPGSGADKQTNCAFYDKSMKL